MSEKNPWELLNYKSEVSRLRFIDFPPSNKPKEKQIISRSDFGVELVLCTICNTFILLGRVSEHFRLRHRNIDSCEEESASQSSLIDCVFPSSPTLSDETSILPSNHFFSNNSIKDINLGSSNNKRGEIEKASTFLTASNQQAMLQECFPPQTWAHDNHHSQTSKHFGSQDPFTVSSSGIGNMPPVNEAATTTVEAEQLCETHSSSKTPDVFDFYDILPETSDLYENDISFVDSNAYFSDFLHSTEGFEIQKPSATNQQMTQPKSTYSSSIQDSDFYLAMGHSEASDCQSHTLETPSPDFFTLPSASSSSTYSVDSGVFNNLEGFQGTNMCFSDQPVYGKNYEIKSSPTSMPILVRFNNTTPARLHGDNDVEVEQAVASIVDLDAVCNETADKASPKKELEQPPIPCDEELKSEDKLPILSPMDAVVNSSSEPAASDVSNGWGDTTAAESTRDLDWEIWNSFDLPSCDYTEAEMCENLALLKSNDLLSSLEPYVPESSEAPTTFEVSLPVNVCHLHEQRQLELPHANFLMDQAVAVEAPTATGVEDIKPGSTLEIKTSRNDTTSRSRRPADCLNGSLPLHLWPFDPRLHCGVKRDGAVCRRSLLCKLHPMGLKRQVERPQDISILVKQLREAKRLKKMSLSKREVAESSVTERRSSSPAFILPNPSANTLARPADHSRSKSDHVVFVDTNLKYVSGTTPIKPASEMIHCGVAPQQTLTGITNDPTTASTLLRCAYSGRQLPVSRGFLSPHSGLRILETGNMGRFGEKHLHLQQPAFSSNGAPSGLTVISDAIQTSTLNCDQSLFATTTGPYLQFDHNSTGNRATPFLQNQQLCAVLGMASKTGSTFEVDASQATTQQTNGFASLNPPQCTANSQAATIIVGHPDGSRSGTVQYTNDKVDSINLLSPNAGPGCISLPPRSARVFQLILPQSATALSLRPHPGSGGSASVIQLTTTGSSALGATTIPLKQTPLVVEAAMEASKPVDESALQNTIAVDLQASSELSDQHLLQPEASSLLTLAEWEQLHKTGNVVIAPSRGLEFSDTTSRNNMPGDINQFPHTPISSNDISTAYNTTISAHKSNDESDAWLDFQSSASSESSPFRDLVPSSQPQPEDFKDTKAATNQHSKLRVLLFDVDDDDDEEEEDNEVKCADLERRENQEDTVVDKSNEERTLHQKLSRKLSVIGSTNTIPTAIVAPTTFSASITDTHNGPLASSIAEEITKDPGKAKTTTLSKRRRLSCNATHGQHDICFHSASSLKPKRPEDSTNILSSPTSGSMQNAARLPSPNCVDVATSIGGCMTEFVSGGGDGGTGGQSFLSVQPHVTGSNQFSVNTAHQFDGVSLPVSSGVNCGGNIIICSGGSASSSNLQQANTTCTVPMGVAGPWHNQMKSQENRQPPLSLVRLPSGQLAAVPSSVLNGTPTLPPPQQPILQSHGTALVLRYPQQQTVQRKIDQYDARLTDLEGHRLQAAAPANLSVVNGVYQFQQATQFQQQQRLVMVSSGSKNVCYTTDCDHMTVPSAGVVRGESSTSPSTAAITNGISEGVKTTPTSQSHALNAAFSQTSTHLPIPSAQLQTPAGSMTVLVRGANSQSSLQLLIPQPDGTMVLQPATIQNQFSNGSISGVLAGSGGIAVLPSDVAAYNSTIGPNSYISLPPRAGGTGERGAAGNIATVFQTPTGGGICDGGQFAVDEAATPNAAAASAAGYIEFVTANRHLSGADGSRSIVTTGDLSKWVRNGTTSTKFLNGRLTSPQQVYHQPNCLDSVNSTIIQLPQQNHQPQQQQLVFITPNGTAASGPNMSFGNVATIVQQPSGIEQGRTIWTASTAGSIVSSAAAVSIPNGAQNQ